MFTLSTCQAVAHCIPHSKQPGLTESRANLQELQKEQCTVHHYWLVKTQPSILLSSNKSQVNAMLALGCHFTNSPQACADPGDTATKGDHYFAEAKRLFIENEEFEKPRLTTIQALW